MTDFFQGFFIGCDEGRIVGSNCQDFIASINDLLFFFYFYPGLLGITELMPLGANHQ